VSSSNGAASWNSWAGLTNTSTALQPSLKTSFCAVMQKQQQQKRAIACVTPMT